MPLAVDFLAVEENVLLRLALLGDFLAASVLVPALVSDFSVWPEADEPCDLANAEAHISHGAQPTANSAA